MQKDVDFKQFTLFDLQVLENNIWYWENALSFPNELNTFIEEIDSEPLSYSRISKWNNWTASDDSNLIYGATKNISMAQLKETTGSDEVDKKTLYIANSFAMAFEMASDRYFAGHNLDKARYNLEINTIPIKKWNQGQSMGPHFDGQDGNKDLAFSLVAYINDDYEGGEINFPNQNVTVKPKAGSLIMFPSQLPYLHEVKPIVSGTRYMSPAHAYIK
jgi:predicted 2-oxoglutarate/Fe(II)-dependent dioxygenase YbiX